MVESVAGRDVVQAINPKKAWGTPHHTTPRHTLRLVCQLVFLHKPRDTVRGERRNFGTHHLLLRFRVFRLTVA